MSWMSRTEVVAADHLDDLCVIETVEDFTALVAEKQRDRIAAADEIEIAQPADDLPAFAGERHILIDVVGRDEKYGDAADVGHGNAANYAGNVITIRRRRIRHHQIEIAARPQCRHRRPGSLREFKIRNRT